MSTRVFEGLDDIQKATIKKTLKRSYGEQDLMLECARDFGFLLASGEKNGLPMRIAFEAAKEHFRVYGKAMTEFADLVTIEMMPARKSAEAPPEPSTKKVEP